MFIGIYDLNGNAMEYVAAFNKAYSGTIYTGNNLSAKGTHFASTGGNSTKYATAYSNNTNTISNNYTVGNVSNLGDAMHEVYAIPDRAWFLDQSMFVNSTAPFLLRGGYYNQGTAAGTFYTGITDSASTFSSFRVVLVAE